MSHSLVTPALILHSIIISFVAAWLARDTALASSVHSLQEMTNRVKDNRILLDAAIRHSEQAVWSPQFYYLVNPSLFVSSSFPSDPPGWLVTQLWLQACTVFRKWLTQTKDERHPLRAIKNDSA